MDFGLKVTRISSQVGNYVVDLSFIHVRNVLGYNIYRSENQSEDPADWTKINSKIIQVNYYQDRGFTGDPVQNDKVAWFYKVVPVKMCGTEIRLSDSKTETFTEPIFGVQKWVAPTIRSRTNMLLDPSRFSSAEAVHFLVRKWAGQYCSCINIRTRSVDANCAKCAGTGYAGAYELIENVYCRIRSTTKKLVGDSGGIMVDDRSTGIIATYPRITEGDVVIRLHNERFRLRNVKQRKTQGYITAQTFTLEKIQLYDMVYRVPAPPIVDPTQRQGHRINNVLS